MGVPEIFLTEKGAAGQINFRNTALIHFSKSNTVIDYSNTLL